MAKLKGDLWKSDWFFGLTVSLLFFVFAYVINSDLLESLDRKAYDMGVRMSSKTPNDKIAIIAIDDQSIANIGRWPWNRDVHAKMTDMLTAAHAKVIGNTVFFFEPQQDPGLVYINKLLDIYAKSAGSAPTAAVAPAPDAASASPAVEAAAPQAQVSPEMAQIGALLKEAEVTLNTDRKLAESYTKAGNVVLPLNLTLGDPLGKPDKALPDFTKKNVLEGKGSDGDIRSAAVQLPIDPLGRAVAGMGHLNDIPDVDGAIRTEPLVVQYFDVYFPSFALMVAAKSLNLSVNDIKVDWGNQVKLSKLTIPTDNHNQMYTYFYKDRDGKKAFQIDSFYDVLSGKIPMSKYADKIVLIGATAAGVGTSFPTPVTPAMTPVEKIAHSVSSILSEHFFVSPGWAVWVKLLAFIGVAAYLVAALPRLKARPAAIITLGILVAIFVVHFGLMVSAGMWIPLMVPATLLLVGHLLLTTKRYIVTEAGKQKSDVESAESNRMLGLAFQGQGQFDMAFDKFRKVPFDGQLMDNLYNLALDFERKRQFNKAQAVYEHMHGYDSKYKDLESKITRAKNLSETVILGGGSSRGNASILDTAGAGEKPMLGRYQVEKELGKGAMGVVYQGRDPKISRVVAIKTMALSQEFEADELEEAKARFFREAETAGRLNHPNIVTIYDAGEEHDLCFIAMELLKGKDLVPYTKPETLLPISRVVSITVRVADALGYAHRQNVVHRDIKPANIMYDLEGDSPKVTDFGIARVTDSSKTKTGMVLGTPSYMSPEQLSGKKVDGRSDLFSLAVSLYQMLSGHLPFVGDSMAQLMFKIANEQAPDIRTINPAVPEGLAEVLAYAMAKEAEQRYQSGEELAAALRPFGETPATSTGMNIPAAGATGGVRPPTQQIAPQGARPAPAPAAPNPHAGGTVQMQAVPTAESDKTVIMNAVPMNPDATQPMQMSGAKPGADKPTPDKPAPDVDISL
ncbi:MAG: serine/threonine protein kinase PrkC, regulator of stationary phase [Betaproteobacteria bacterium]|nr:serine/threonine protein kinase PrkC, regulator of stationary phase [Betaproteobacteria bacterium]